MEPADADEGGGREENAVHGSQDSEMLQLMLASSNTDSHCHAASNPLREGMYAADSNAPPHICLPSFILQAECLFSALTIIVGMAVHCRNCSYRVYV